MKEKTMTEAVMEMQEEIRKSELRYWQKMHPRAKVILKDSEIQIIYPLPQDYKEFMKELRT